MMNLSTAYWEFGNLSKAIETLRDAKTLAKNEKLDALLASICGNLAKYLVFDDVDNREIYELFSLEENYFKESKEYRSVVVSLLNQYAFYDKTGNDEMSLSKLKEAVEIIKSHKFPEFKEILAHYNQISSKKGLDKKIFIAVCKRINKWLNQLNSKTKCKIVENTDDRCVMYQVEEREKYIFVNELALQISATEASVIMQITANLVISRDNIWKDLKNYLDWLISITMDFVQYDEKSNKIIFQFEFDLTKAKGGLLSNIPALIKIMEYKWRAEETALTLVVTGDYGMDEIKQMRTMITSCD